MKREHHYDAPVFTWALALHYVNTHRAVPVIE